MTHGHLNHTRISTTLTDVIPVATIRVDPVLLYSSAAEAMIL